MTNSKLYPEPRKIEEAYSVLYGIFGTKSGEVFNLLSLHDDIELRPMHVAHRLRMPHSQATACLRWLLRKRLITNRRSTEGGQRMKSFYKIDKAYCRKINDLLRPIVDVDYPEVYPRNIVTPF